MKQIIFALASLLIISACSKKDDPAPASNDNPDLPTTQWYAYKGNEADTVQVMNGYLYMTSKYVATKTKSTAVSSFRKIKGDFELRVKFSSFTPTGTNITSETFSCFLTKIEGQSATPILSGILGKNYMYAEDSTPANTLIKPSTNREGEWYVKRVGSDYTTWLRAGTDTLKLNKTNYSAADLTMNFAIDASDNTPTKTSVHIDDFILTGGLGTDASTDSFDENSVTVY